MQTNMLKQRQSCKNVTREICIGVCFDYVLILFLSFIYDRNHKFKIQCFNRRKFEINLIFCSIVYKRQGYFSFTEYIFRKLLD